MKLFPLVFFIPILAGCASYTPRDVSGDPSAISVPIAMKSVGEGFAALQASLNGGYMGVIACRVEVKFNISAQAASGGKFGGELGATITPVEAKLSAEQDNSSQGNRGNTIDIVLGSVDTERCGKAGGGTTGDASTATAGNNAAAAPRTTSNIHTQSGPRQAPTPTSVSTASTSPSPTIPGTPYRWPTPTVLISQNPTLAKGIIQQYMRDNHLALVPATSTLTTPAPISPAGK